MSRREDESPVSDDFKKISTNPIPVIEVKLPQNGLNCLLLLKDYDLSTPENDEKVKFITFSPQALSRLWGTMHSRHYDYYSPPLIQTKFNIYFKRAYLCIAGAAAALSGFSNELKSELPGDIAAMIASFLPFNKAVSVAIIKKTIYKSAKEASGGSLFIRSSDKPVQLPKTAAAALSGFGNELKPKLDKDIANVVGSFLALNDTLNVAKTKKTIYELARSESGGALFNWSNNSRAQLPNKSDNEPNPHL